MKIDLKAPICDRAGAPIKNDEITLDLKTALLAALDAQLPSEQGPGHRVEAGHKIRLYKLGMAIFEAETIDLPAEDITLLKARVAEAYAPLVVGRVFDLIDPAPA